MRNPLTAFIVMVALGMGVVQWAQSQGLSSINASDMRLAVKTGSVDRVQALIRRGVNANVKDADGYTPLHQAAVDGFPEAVEALLATTPKPDVDAKTNDGYTALHLAAAGGTKGHLKVVESLLEADAEVDEEAPEERTALHIAAWGGHSEIVKALLDEDASIDEKAAGGWTPLHLAVHGATQGHLDSVLLLRDNGADRNIEAKERKPWQYAFERGQGAIVDILNPLVSPALIDAVADDDADEVRDLIAAGYSEVNEKNDSGQSTVYLAVLRKQRDVLRELLDADGIDVNAKARDDYGPLHVAVHHQDSDADTPAGKNLLNIVKDLIAADGIDVNMLGGTALGALRPLQIAINRSNDKAAQALRDAGAMGVPTGTLVFSPTETLAVPEGGSADLGVKLSTKPDRSVVINARTGKIKLTFPLPPSQDKRISLSGTRMTFTPSNWNTFQTIKVTSTTTDEDAVDIEDIFITFSSASNDGFRFESLPIEKSVKIDDDEEVGFVVSRTGSPGDRLQIEEGQYIEETMRLSSKPTETVTFRVLYAWDGGPFPFLNSLWFPKFTPQNWNIPQTVRIDATHDDNSTPERVSMRYEATSTGNEYDDATFVFDLVSIDDDVERPIFNPFRGLTVTEGKSKTFTLRLGTKPREQRDDTESVSCYISEYLPPCASVVTGVYRRGYTILDYPTGDNPKWTEGTRHIFNQASTLFSQDNWNIPQTITVTPPEDTDIMPENVTVRVNIWSAGYSPPSGFQSTEYPIRVEDDDIQGRIHFSPTDFEVNEGGSSNLSISLSAKPKQPIEISPESNLTGIGFAVDEFTIAPENWNKPYQLKVTSRDEESLGIRDDMDRTGRIVLRVADGLTTPTMTIGLTEKDTEVKGSIVQTNTITLNKRVKISEGGPGRISVSLDKKPDYNTTLHIAKSNNNVTIPGSLTFTPENWNTPQVFTFRAGYTSGNHDTSTTLTLSTTGSLISDPVTIPVDIISAGQHRFLHFLFDVAGEKFQTHNKLTFHNRAITWKTDFGNTKWREGEEYKMKLKLSGPVPATWERESLNVSYGVHVWNKHNFRMHTNIRAGGTKASISPRVWYFNEHNWNETVTFTITTKEDDDANQEIFEVGFDENAHYDGGPYIKGAGRMVIRFPPIEDNDVNGRIILSKTYFSSNDKGQKNSFTVKLDTKPKDDIIVTLKKNGGGSIPSDIRFSKTSLTFTPTNYSQTQTIDFTTHSDADTQCDLSSYKLKAGEGYSAEAVIRIYVKDDLNEYC